MNLPKIQNLILFFCIVLVSGCITFGSRPEPLINDGMSGRTEQVRHKEIVRDKNKILPLTKEHKDTRRSDYLIQKNRIIVIDPGHGGKDPGAIGRGGVKEKKVVLDISRRVRKILKGKGFDIVMTRNRDEFISLEKRTLIASRVKADLFVSIHANSSPVRGVHGVEVFYLRRLNSKEKNEDQREISHQIFFKNSKMKKDSKSLKKILKSMLYTKKQADAVILAQGVARKVAQFGRTKNLGAKRSRFYVLKNTIMPAILVEVGFLSNPRERKRLISGAYRQRIANGLAQGILEYFNGN